MGDSLSCSLANIVKVGSVAFDYATDSNYGIKITAFGELRASVDKFKTTRYAFNGYAAFCNAILLEGLYGTFKERVCNMVVPLCNDNAKSIL